MTATLRKYDPGDLPELELPSLLPKRDTARAYRPLTAAKMGIWYDKLADDPSLSAFAHRAARKIGRRIDLAVGFTEISGQEIANQLRVCLRTATRAVKELVDQGHLAKETRRGRGLANRYWPIIEA